MKIKRGVIMQGIRPQMRRVLISADSVWRHLGRELVITSATDGEHAAGSLHYYGAAVDLRTRYFTVAQANDAANLLRGALQDGKYTVVNEGSHIHVQWDGIKEIES